MKGWQPSDAFKVKCTSTVGMIKNAKTFIGQQSKFPSVTIKLKFESTWKTKSKMDLKVKKNHSLRAATLGVSSRTGGGRSTASRLIWSKPNPDPDPLIGVWGMLMGRRMAGKLPLAWAGLAKSPGVIGGTCQWIRIVLSSWELGEQGFLKWASSIRVRAWTF